MFLLDEDLGFEMRSSGDCSTISEAFYFVFRLLAAAFMVMLYPFGRRLG